MDELLQVWQSICDFSLHGLLYVQLVSEGLNSLRMPIMETNLEMITEIYSQAKLIPQEAYFYAASRYEGLKMFASGYWNGLVSPIDLIGSTKLSISNVVLEAENDSIAYNSGFGCGIATDAIGAQLLAKVAAHVIYDIFFRAPTNALKKYIKKKFSKNE